jgi:hypothetical protein
VGGCFCSSLLFFFEKQRELKMTWKQRGSNVILC